MDKSKLGKYFFAFVVLLTIGFGEFILIKYIYCLRNGLSQDSTENVESLIVFIGSTIVTFLSSVLAQDQTDKIKNSSFGALASGAITLLISLIQKEHNIDLLLSAFFGSAVGALNGWIIYVFIAVLAWIEYRAIIPFIELITHGLESMSDEILSYENSDSKTNLKYYFERINNELNTRIVITDNLSALDKNQLPNNQPEVISKLLDQRKEYLVSMIRFMLTIIVEELNLVFQMVSFRSSIIKFDIKNSTEDKGEHWIYYYGAAHPYKKDQDFDQDSEAYKIVTGKKASPQFYDLWDKNLQIASRNTGDRHKFFNLFKLNDNCVLTIDWIEKNRKTKTPRKIINQIQLIIEDSSLISTIGNTTWRLIDLENQIKKRNDNN